MPARHRSRQRALQVLFTWDMRRMAIEEAISAFYDTLHSEEEEPERPAPDLFMESLVTGAVDRIQVVDEAISGRSSNWRIERMPAVDRNVLRLAVYELMATDTPAPVVIDEALELARQFSGDDSVKFVNGVLDAIRKDQLPKA